MLENIPERHDKHQISILNEAILYLKHLNTLFSIYNYGYLKRAEISETSEARVQFPAWPQVGKLVVACR